MAIRPKCKYCGNPGASNGKSGKFNATCASCLNQIARSGVAYKQFRKTFCESCGFVALDSCQLDVDHVDGNRRNNSLDNLRTLCANCHRLKTKLERIKT